MTNVSLAARPFRRGLFILLALLCATLAFAQTYTVDSIQYNPSNPGGPSAHLGQHVHVGAIVTGNAVNIGLGGTNSFFIQDRDTTSYHGIFVKNGTSSRTVAIGDSVVVYGTVQNSGGENLINCGFADSVTVIAHSIWTPVSATVAISQLASSATAVPWTGMLVSVPNVSVSTMLTDGATIRSGSDSIDISGLGRWTYPLFVGDSLRAVAGNFMPNIIGNTTTAYLLQPRNDGDFQSYGNNAPVITNVGFTPANPSPADHVMFGVRAHDIETHVSEVWLDYTVGSTHMDSLVMQPVPGSPDSFSVSAGPWSYGSAITFRVKAMDDQGAIGASTQRSITINFLPIQYFYDHIDSFVNKTVNLEGMVIYTQKRLSAAGNPLTDAYFIDTVSKQGVYDFEFGDPLSIPGMKRGCYVRIPAAVTTYYSASQHDYQIELQGATTWTVLDSNLAIPSALALGTGDYGAQHRLIDVAGHPVGSASDYYASGAWCEFTGRVMSVDANVGGGTNILIDDGSGTVAIRIWDTAGIRRVISSTGDSIPLTAIVNQEYTIRGVASRYGTDFQMLTGYAADIIPVDNTLGQAYSTFINVPARVLVNDLSEQMNIEYGAPSGCRVQVRVFNLKGQLVATLIDKTSSGISATKWDGRSDLKEKLPLGTYIIQVESNNKGTTKQAIAPIVIGTKL